MSESREINAQSHEQKECAEQQPLEGFDDGFDGAAVFGFGEHQPGDKGAQRHRKPGHAGGHPGANCYQQGCRHEEIGTVGSRHHAQHRAQAKTANTDDDEDGERRLGKGDDNTLQHRAVSVAAQYCDEQQERDDGQILKQQNGKTGAPGLRSQTFCIGQKLHNNGGR